ncbi:VOC family protein [Microbacterium sp. P02]|uniref:VOC family protein n=1 Tax=Microbacterium sp. P02 TaxID=3366260 RepID=UPI00367023CE
MTVPALLDHVVIAGPDLEVLVGWFAAATGVTAAAGGRHPTGTANHLVALTVDGARVPHYIELIAPDADSDIVPTTFGIVDLPGPRIVTYAVHPDDIGAVAERARAAGYDPGPVTPLSRRTPDGSLLEWTLVRAADPVPEVPFLIDWGTTPQPGLGDLPTIELVSFTRIEEDPERVIRLNATLGLGDGGTAEVVQGSPSRFELVLRTADGTLVTL